MKNSLRLLAVLLLVCGWSGRSLASHDQEGCEIRGHETEIVWTESRHISRVDFKGTHGQLSVDPLLTASVRVTGHASCLSLQLSAMARPGDDRIVFQVRVDGVPAKGHLQDLFGTGVAGIVDFKQTAGTRLDRMVSYTFAHPVDAGEHTVEVLFAGCCSGRTRGLAVVDAATLTIHYK